MVESLTTKPVPASSFSSVSGFDSTYRNIKNNTCQNVDEPLGGGIKSPNTMEKTAIYAASAVMARHYWTVAQRPFIHTRL